MKQRKGQRGKRDKTNGSGAVTEGVVIADSCLRVLGLDSGARIILSDLTGATGRDTLALPAEIANLIDADGTDGDKATAVRFAAAGVEYSCRPFFVEPITGDGASSLVALHLKREVSVTETVHHVGTDYHLTDREQEALLGISRGLTSKELAQQMNISPNTVKAFLRLIMIKMGASTRAGVVGKLLEQDSPFQYGQTARGGDLD
jgi:DNA-binding CsgD family transcriptional regulator